MAPDPRVRLWHYVVTLAALLATSNPTMLAVFCVVALAVIVALRALRRWLMTVRLLAPLLIILALTSALTGSPGEALAPVLKLLALGSCSAAFFAAMTIEELGDALLLLRLPPGISFVLVGGLRFAPLVSERWEGLHDARRARGVPLPRGLRALPEYARLLAPLFVRVLRTADDLAEAMESRGFGEVAPTLPVDYRLRLYDWALLVLAALLFVAYLVLAPR